MKEKLILKTGKIARLAGVGDPLLVTKNYGGKLQDPSKFLSFAKLFMILAKTSVVEYVLIKRCRIHEKIDK